MADFPSFDDFYRAIHDRDPFPWQRRLAAQVIEGGWPDAIGIPTGLGKTSSIDVAIWAIAAEADLPPRTRQLPTRVWYVVNRRLLVDAAYDHGVALASVLADPIGASCDEDARQVLEAVAAALSCRGGGGVDPLYVGRLRGNAELGARPPDPSQSAVIFSTVPMFASRWLFRGYGTSHTMRSVDAALAGIDSLVLLDEAHLARPLLSLAGPLAQCDAGDPSGILPESRARCRLVSLTATGTAQEAFGLDDDDYEHPVVAGRLNAKKPVDLVECPKGKLAVCLAREVVGHLENREPSTAVLFANSPVIARAAFEELRRTTAGRAKLRADLLLLTGRTREREAAAVRNAVLNPETGAPAGRLRQPRAEHLIVVATQTLEVGADLDFDVLVTEICGARALVQRVGRLNRLGEVDDAAGSVVFAAGEESFGIYGVEPLDIWDRLRAAASDGRLDLGPRYVASTVGELDDVQPRAGELLPAHLWEWVKTTTAPPGEAPVELFFDAIEMSHASISMLWRAIVPDAGTEVHPAVTAAETIEVPLWEARAALATLSPGDAIRLARDRVTVEGFDPRDLRPGDIVVLSATSGCYDAFGWSPEAHGEVLDLSLLRPPGVPLDPIALSQLAAPGDELSAALETAKIVAEAPDPDDDLDAIALSKEIIALLEAAGPSPMLTGEEWDEFFPRLRPQIGYLTDERVGRLITGPSNGYVMEADLRADAFDELSFTASSPDLAQHLGSVGEVAIRIATEVGLPHELVEAVGAAGRFHDLGKADSRFQRWLDPIGRSEGPVAKSGRRREQWERDRLAAGWPRGGRHEELSRRLVSAYLARHEVVADSELVLHLVVSHHGYGRPLVPGIRDDVESTVVATVEGVQVEVGGDLGDVDWHQPARFRECCERYGYWGLALLEAIVRQADHQVSKVVVA